VKGPKILKGLAPDGRIEKENLLEEARGRKVPPGKADASREGAKGKKKGITRLNVEGSYSKVGGRSPDRQERYSEGEKFLLLGG